MTDDERTPAGPDEPADDTAATGDARATDPAPGDPAPPEVAGALAPGDASLLALVDRLATLLDRSDLTELEVEVGGTGLVLRKPAALAPAVAAAPAATSSAPGPEAGAAPSPSAPAAAPAGGVQEASAAPSRPVVRAPLTGIYWGAPAPGAAPYVQVGGEVAVGQIVGLIEAMKLFNEIKSDKAGRVARIVADNGQLVKVNQPLIEVEPL